MLEDTDGDGKADRFTIFAEGLNIPSGIAVGHGGVWVANSPDILFLRDTDGDGRADQREVVVTGFGRDDTHELPNSLTWGPDGWLYGWNGVFNRSVVEQGGQALRLHLCDLSHSPANARVSALCEGTSNPWGIAWDAEGALFVSACVIDHLWHLAETGYYIRQGGPYPPHTWPMQSIVDHKHQKAAYCGIHYFDSDAYPSEYRRRLYMGNIHGGAVNVDVFARDGSTYHGEAAPDFLVANDAWFMPVVQKTGPDGSLYILDWYDRYHCYQDARRDPEGIDRLKGRLYRVRYRDTPRAPRFDLAAESDARLIERLGSPNVYYRDIAQRLLAERAAAETRLRLEELVADAAAPRTARMHALWALLGGGPLAVDFHRALLADADPGFRAWGVRAAGNMAEVDAAIRDRVVALARDKAPEVRVQVAIAACKLSGVDALALLTEVLATAGDDKLIPHIVWQNAYPLLEHDSQRFFDLLARAEPAGSAAVAAMMPRAVDRVLALHDPRPIAALVKRLESNAQSDPAALTKCLQGLAHKFQTREVTAAQLAELRPELEATIRRLMASTRDRLLADDAALVAATWNEPQAVARVRELVGSVKSPPARLRAGVRRADRSRRPAARSAGRRAAGGRAGLPRRASGRGDRLAGPRRCAVGGAARVVRLSAARARAASQGRRAVDRAGHLGRGAARRGGPR